jgi:serine/threonine protein kinase
LCDDGLVPQCYGFTDFPDWNPALGCPSNPMPNQLDPWKFFRNDVKSPMALFLEYFPDMKHLSFYNLTADVANAALSILTRIHEAHILHNDFFPRNILVSRNGRVVVVCIVPSFTWSGLIQNDPKVDFGDAVIHPDDTAAYVGEISKFMCEDYLVAWDMFFGHMVRAEILCLHKISLFTRSRI